MVPEKPAYQKVSREFVLEKYSEKVEDDVLKEFLKERR